MKKLSVVIPCYNEEEAVPLFYEAFLKETNGMPAEFEFIFVDDGSRDGTLKQFEQLHERDERVHYISFSRNFGKESAMFAGMEAATGDYVAIMDVDLQDPPALLPEMLEAIEEEGYDCVASRRVTRKGEPPIRSFFARAFYRLINKISKTEIVDGARDFRLMTRQMVNAILELPGSRRRHQPGAHDHTVPQAPSYKAQGRRIRCCPHTPHEHHWYAGSQRLRPPDYRQGMPAHPGQQQLSPHTQMRTPQGKNTKRPSRQIPTAFSYSLHPIP